MKLPNRKNAYIPRSKIKDYLLSETHAAGKSKAKFFNRIGFNNTNIDILEQDLYKIANTNDVIEISSSLHGEKYIIDGNLYTPNKKKVKIRTIWIIDKFQEKPRFVTAYPN